MPKEIVIVGGGIAGLTAAYYLAKHGPAAFQITLLEAESETGGQARAFRIGSDTVEHGSHVFFHYYKTITGLIDELRRDPELSKEMPPLAKVHGWTIVDAKGNRATLKQASYLPAPLSVVPSILAIGWLSWVERLRICWGALMVLLRDYSEFHELDKVTSQELGTESGYGPEGIKAWNSASLGLTNLFISEQSGAVFCAKHKVLIETDQGLDYRITAGNLTKVFAEPMTKKLVSMGVRIVYGATATSLGRPAGTTKTRVGYTTPRGDAEVNGDHVILALRPQDAAKLVRWVKAPWTELVPVSPVITAVIHLSGRVEASKDYRELGLSRESWAFSVVTDLSEFWEEYRGDKTVLRVEVGHADLLEEGVETTDEALAKVLKADLDRLYPEIADMTIERIAVHREPKHLYVRWAKGQWSKKPEERYVGQGVYLAGDWTTKGTIGMEAAANSGIEAANHVLAQHGFTAVPFEDVPL